MFIQKVLTTISRVVLFPALFSSYVFSSHAMAVTDNAPKTKVDHKYYRHIMFRETPYASYRGIYPVASDDAPNFAHYRFEFDEQNRMTGIRYQINDALISGNQVWDSFIWFAPQVKIAYRDNKEIHTYFNSNGEQISAHGAVYEAHYTLDEQGNRVALHFYNLEGEATQSAWNIHRYEWHHNNNKVYEKRFNLNGQQQPLRPEFEFYEVELEYDAKGQLAFIRNMGTEGIPSNNASGAGIDRITYDHNGNFIRWQVYDKDGLPVEGNRPMVHLGEHLYDAFGNKVGLRGFDRYGKRIPFSWNALEHVQTYNPFGNQLEHIMYAPDGHVIMHLQREYNNEETRLSWLKSLDSNGDLITSPALGGAAAIQFIYEQDGSVTRHQFTADMVKLEKDS